MDLGTELQESRRREEIFRKAINDLSERVKRLETLQATSDFAKKVNPNSKVEELLGQFFKK